MKRISQGYDTALPVVIASLFSVIAVFAAGWLVSSVPPLRWIQWGEKVWGDKVPFGETAAVASYRFLESLPLTLPATMLTTFASRYLRPPLAGIVQPAGVVATMIAVFTWSVAFRDGGTGAFTGRLQTAAETSLLVMVLAGYLVVVTIQESRTRARRRSPTNP